MKDKTKNKSINNIYNEHGTLQLMPACESETVRAHQPLRRTAESQGPGDLLRLCHHAPAGGRSEEGQERVRPTQGFGGGTSEVGFGAEGGHRIPQGQGKPTGPGNQEGGE